ncbi:MAG: GDP-mannose 4,6-dehydratase [Candidatus Margulisbacteria bacterium]|nr:GDP-mannose 4,6-dehydratase [Candidatus Margulisiibacteriota bacterium]
MKVLITGINGFVGSYLADLSLKKGDAVWGLTNDAGNVVNIGSIADKITVLAADLNDKPKIKRLLAELRPQIIYHLAGIRGGTLAELIAGNAYCTANLLAACLAAELDGRIVVVGSSSQYGVGGRSKYTERRPYDPNSNYGISKCVQDLICRSYLNNTGLKIIGAVPFNHVGPREPDSLIASFIAKQVAGIEAGDKTDTVVLKGDAAAVRDFTDVRDIAAAYYLIARKGRVGQTYNVCSGEGTSVTALIDLFRSVSGLKFKVKAVGGAGSDNIQIGDPAKIAAELKWRRKIPLKRSLADLLVHWREKLG